MGRHNVLYQEVEYTKHTLSNGLRLIIVPFENMESATVTVWANVGSRYEDPLVGGISHFLEHMVFKGSKKRPTAREIAESVDSIGGEFNAATSKEWTNFYIKSRVAVLDTAFDVLSDMVLNPFLKQDDINREKGVILEELALYEDTPTARIGDLFEQVIYEGNNLGKDIIGTPKTIKATKKADFEKYRQQHYFAQNLLITVSGGVSESQALKLTEKYFGALHSKDLKEEIGKFDHPQKSPKVLLKTQKKEQGHFMIGFLGTERGHKDRFVEAILATILGGGMSSRLFSEIREKRGLAYSVRTNTEHYRDTGYIETYSGVELSKIDEAVTVVLEQHYGISNNKFPISNKELRKAKEYLKGHMALSLEDTRVVNHFFGEEELLLGKMQTPEEVFKAIDKVNTEDILRVSKDLFKKDKLNLAVIGPYEDKSRFEKLLS